MLLTCIRNLLSFRHYINMFNKIAGPAMFMFFLKMFLVFLGLLSLYLMFLLLYLIV